jgi:hypothetical protein
MANVLIGEPSQSSQSSSCTLENVTPLAVTHTHSSVQSKITNYALFNPNVNKYTIFDWLSSLLDKQYCQEQDGINRNHLAVAMLSAVKQGLPAFKDGRLLRFEHCHRLVRYKICKDCGEQTPFPFSCNDPLCDTCSPNRKKVFRPYYPLIRAMRNPKLLSIGMEHLKQSGHSVSWWFSKINKLIRWLQSHYPVVSGFVVWHLQSGDFLNFHIIFDCPVPIPNFKDNPVLNRQWTKISGDKPDRFVWLNRCSPKKAMDYITRYLIHSPEFDSTADAIYFATTRYRKRVLSTFGLLYATKQNKKKRTHYYFCSTCRCYTEHSFTRSWSYSQSVTEILQTHFSDGIP